jgi:hypothetical protein
MFKRVFPIALTAAVLLLPNAAIAQDKKPVPATFKPWKAALIEQVRSYFGHPGDASALRAYKAMSDQELLERFSRIKGICAAIRKDNAEAGVIRRDSKGLRITYEGSYLDEIYEEEFAETGSAKKASTRLDMARYEADAVGVSFCK